MFISFTNSASLPARYSARATLALFAELITIALIRESSVSISPLKTFILAPFIFAAFSDMLTKVSIGIFFSFIMSKAVATVIILVTEAGSLLLSSFSLYII